MGDEFQRFIAFCKEQLGDRKDLVKLIKKRYREADPDYIESEDFTDLLEQTQTNIEDDQRVFVHLRDLLNALKKNQNRNDEADSNHGRSNHSSDSEQSRKRFKFDPDSEDESGVDSGEPSKLKHRVIKYSDVGSESESDSERQQKVNLLINGLTEDIERNENNESIKQSNGEDIPSDDDFKPNSNELDAEELDAESDNLEPDATEEDNGAEIPSDDDIKPNSNELDAVSDNLKLETADEDNGVEFPSDDDIKPNSNELDAVSDNLKLETADEDNGVEITSDDDFKPNSKELDTVSDTVKPETAEEDNDSDIVSGQRKVPCKFISSCSSDSDLPEFDCTLKSKEEDKTSSAKVGKDVRDTGLSGNSQTVDVNKKYETEKNNIEQIVLSDSENDVTFIEDDKKNNSASDKLKVKTNDTGDSDEPEKKVKGKEKSKQVKRKFDLTSDDDDSSEIEPHRKISQKRRKKFVISVGKKSIHNSKSTSPKQHSPQKPLSYPSPRKKFKSKSPNKAKISPNKNIVIITDSESGSDCDLSKESFVKKLDEKYGNDPTLDIDQICAKSKLKEGKLKGLKRVSTKHEKSEFKEIKKVETSYSFKSHYSDAKKNENQTDSKVVVSQEVKLDKDSKDGTKTFKLEHSTTNENGKKRAVLETVTKSVTSRKPVEGNREPSPQAGTSRESGEPVAGTSGEENDKKKKASTRQIKRLEKLLEELNKKIEKLQTKELDLNDLDSEVSDYLYEDKLKRKFMKVWDKLCELHNAVKNTGRHTDRYFRYQGTRYPDINKKIERLINRRKVFPDYHDVRNIIGHVNKEKKLHLRGRDLDDLAREAFTDVGNRLQTRRQKDLAQTFRTEDVNVYSSYDDPALYDPSLKKKLESNRKDAKSKMDQVMEKYCRRQMDEGDKTDDDDDDDDDAAEEEEEKAEQELDDLEMDAVITRTMVDNSDSDCGVSGRREERVSPCLEIENIEDGDKTSLDLGKDTDREKLNKFGSGKKENSFPAALGLQAIGASGSRVKKDVGVTKNCNLDTAATQGNVNTESLVESKKVLSAYESHRHLEPSCTQPSELPITIDLDSPTELVEDDDDSLKLQIHSPRHISSMESQDMVNEGFVLGENSLKLEIHSPKHISHNEHDSMKKTLDDDVIIIGDDELQESSGKATKSTGTSVTKSVAKSSSQSTNKADVCKKDVDEKLKKYDKKRTKDEQPETNSGPISVEHLVPDSDSVSVEEGVQQVDTGDIGECSVISDSEESDVLIPLIVRTPEEVNDTDNKAAEPDKDLELDPDVSFVASRIECKKVLSAYETHRHLESSCTQPSASKLTDEAMNDVLRTDSGKIVPSCPKSVQSNPCVIDEHSSSSSDVLIAEIIEPENLDKSTVNHSCSDSHSSENPSQGPNTKTTPRKPSKKCTQSDISNKNDTYTKETLTLESQDVYNLDTFEDDLHEEQDNTFTATKIDNSKNQINSEDDVLLATEIDLNDYNGGGNEEMDEEDEDMLLGRVKDGTGEDDEEDMQLATEDELAEISEQPNSVPDIFEDTPVDAEDGNKTLTEVSETDDVANNTTETVAWLSETDEKRGIEMEQDVCSRTSQSPHGGDCEVLEQTPTEVDLYEENGEIDDNDNDDDDVDDDILNDDEVVSSDYNEKEREITSTSPRNTSHISSVADKLKLPEVKSKLESFIKREKASNGGKTQDRNKTKQKQKSKSFLIVDDEHADLIENYVEPDTSVFSPEVSSSQDVIVLSDSE